MEVVTPEVLWHGGVSENGKPAPAPVFSVDTIAGCLVTAGINECIPPMGCVRFWNIDNPRSAPHCHLELAEHRDVVNVAKFSPCGLMLATASDRTIIVYVAKTKDAWPRLSSSQSLEKIWINPSLTEIYDLQWSPDSKHIVAGAIDCKAEIIRLATKMSSPLMGHTSYVQGVAWDPFDKMVVTQSADRSCRVHAVIDRFTETTHHHMIAYTHCNCRTSTSQCITP